MTSFGKFLSQPNYSDLTFVTNHRPKDLTADVTSVDISEAPDIAGYIPENIVLLTNAMIYKDDPEGLITWIESLKKQKVIALGIKTSRFIKKIDQKVIDYANSLDFPIFIVPANYSLGELLHQITNFVWDTDKEEILFALDIQKRFSRLLFRDSTVSKIIQQLGSIINTPVLLLNPFLNPIAYSHSFRQMNITKEELKKQLSALFTKNGKKEQLFTLYTQNKSELITAKVIPLNNNIYYPSFLVILKPESIPYPISEFAIDQASLVISFSLYRVDSELKTKESIKRNRFFDIIDSLESGESLEEKRTEKESVFQFIYSDYYQIFRVDFKEQLSLTAPLHSGRMTIIGRWLEDNIDRYFTDAAVIQTESLRGFYILLQHRPDNLSEDIMTIHHYIKEQMGIELLFSIGLPIQNIQQLGKTYRQAKIAYESRREYDDQPIILLYGDSGPKQLFTHLDDDETNFYCTTTLKDLAFPEDDYLKDLRETLNVYLAYQCEVTATANHLYIHRNTVKYRIQRCEEILGKEINTPEQTFNLRLALALSEGSKLPSSNQSQKNS